MKGLITICARGGSKGIPGKNIKDIGGFPLIHYTVKVAEELKKRLNADIYLSTDSPSIKKVVASFKYSSIHIDYTRPDFLATDQAGKLDAIIDVQRFAEQENKTAYDFVIDLDVTAPFRTVDDVAEAYRLLFENNDALNIFSVSPAHRNPYFNMVEQKEDGFYSLCKQGRFLTRQSTPKVYDMNASFYIYKKSFFDEKMSSVISPKSLVYEVPHICFDLDHPVDFEFMEYLMENNKLDFNLLK